MVKLQEQMLNSLKEETSKKKKEIEGLKTKLYELKQSINLNYPNSLYDIETLKTEITDLTNRKAKLEIRIRES
jgi:hypothetical protein